MRIYSIVHQNKRGFCYRNILVLDKNTSIANFINEIEKKYDTIVINCIFLGNANGVTIPYTSNLISDMQVYY